MTQPPLDYTQFCTSPLPIGHSQFNLRLVELNDLNQIEIEPISIYTKIKSICFTRPKIILLIKKCEEGLLFLNIR
jgi:hypothetical protein